MRGGARPGAGRKAGARNKRTAELVAKAEAVGMLPHEFLCAVSQGQEIDGVKPTFDQRLDAAKAAAPFYAPKLASVDNKLSGNVGYTAIPVAERDPMDAAARAASVRDPQASRH